MFDYKKFWFLLVPCARRKQPANIKYYFSIKGFSCGTVYFDVRGGSNSHVSGSNPNVCPVKSKHLLKPLNIAFVVYYTKKGRFN